MKNDIPTPIRTPADLGTQLFESSPDCVKLLDVQGHIVSMNENGRCIMEIDDFDAVCGKPWKTLWPEDSHPDIEQAVASARNGNVGHFNAFCPTPKGIPKWWDVVVTPVRADNGEIESFLSVSRDVSAIHQANLERDRLVERFQKIVNQAGAGVLEADAVGQITLVNQKYCDMLGFSEAELRGKSLFDVTAPPSATATQEAFRTLQTANNSLVFDKQYLRKDGSFMWANSSVSALRDTAGAFQGIVAIIVDISESIKAREALQSSEERYRTLFESMDQGFCIIEMIYDAASKPVDYRFLEMNSRFEEHSGLVNAKNKTIKELVPELNDFWFDAYGRVVETGEPLRVEHEAPAMNRWFDVYAIRLGSVDSKRIAIFFRDTTKRRHADEALKQHAALQAYQLELADRLRPLTDPNEVITAACELLGQRLHLSRTFYTEVDDAQGTFFTRQDYTAPGILSIAGPIRRLDDFGPESIALLRNGQTVVVSDVTEDMRTVPYADAYIQINVSAHAALPMLKAGRLSAIFGLHSAVPRQWSKEDLALAQDTLERTWAAVENAHAQINLRLERDRSQSVLHGMSEGYLLYEADWTISEVNEAGARIARLSRAALLGQKRTDALPEAEGAEVEALYRQVKTTGQAGTLEYVHTFPGGDRRWVEVRAQALKEDRLAIFFRDITKRKEAELELRDGDRRKDEFLAMLAHELRNPLAPIGAAAQLLQMPKLDATRVQKTSEVIGRQVRHMTDLIDDLLDVSRVTRGLVSLDRETLQITQVVNNVVEQVSPLIRARHHNLSLHLTPNTPMVSGDKKRLIQVLANVLNNAAKYTPEGGQIQLTTDVRDTDVCIEVCDNGIGMTADLAVHAFDLFAQGERTSDRASGGLGLGLALVKSIVELHGGTVTCYSAGLGKGSTFSVCLPRVSGTGDSLLQQQATNAVVAPVTPLRIMVVDDNVDAAAMLTMLLEAIGHEVIVKHGSYQALERARENPPQVFLLDIGLPEMDGYKLARRLREQPETTDAILVAITGYGQEHDKMSALAAGFDHHLVKPVDIAKLATILATVSDN